MVSQACEVFGSFGLLVAHRLSGKKINLPRKFS